MESLAVRKLVFYSFSELLNIREVADTAVGMFGLSMMSTKGLLHTYVPPKDR